MLGFLLIQKPFSFYFEIKTSPGVQCTRAHTEHMNIWNVFENENYLFTNKNVGFKYWNSINFQHC